MGRRAWSRSTFAALAALAIAALPADAERSQVGNVIVSLNGSIVPRKLPRDHRAPVMVHLAGRILTADGSPPPRVNWIKLELAWRGLLFTHGLPVCPRARLRYATSLEAMQRCGSALVGRGGLSAKVFLPNQKPFGVRAQLLAFNGRTKHRRPAIWAHAYSTRPPGSFVIPFHVHHRPGTFRTVLIATIRRSVGPWPHVANFGITVSRRFWYRGRRHSYLSASCPVPPNFTAGFLSFARATYTFVGGDQITAESVRSCRAR